MSQLGDPPAGALSDSERLASLLRGHITTQLIAAAVRFGIPDFLGTRAVSDTELSAHTGIGLLILRRYLRALAGVGLVKAVGAAHYQATPMARHLCRDTGSLYGQALMSGAQYYEAWADLDISLRTGGSAFEHRFGHGLWAELAANTEVAAAFTRTMRWNTERVLDEILGMYRFPANGVVADLGAGDGVLVAGLLGRFPALRALVVEQPAVIEHTRAAMQARGVDDRCTFIASDLLRAVPAGADVYILKSVIHNWDDPAALTILGNCRTAMAGHGRLLLIERAMTEDETLDAAVRDLVMLVLFGSHDRTPQAYVDLLAAADFTVNGTYVGPTGICMIDGRPPTGD